MMDQTLLEPPAAETMNLDAAIEALAALGQRSRLQVFRLLVRAGPEGVPAGAIARALTIPANTMSAHLAVLARAGLISAQRSGRVVRYRIEAEAVQALFRFLVADCCDGRPELCAPLAGVACGPEVAR